MSGGGLKVGLLGGSFNPAHDGHRYISLEALRRLGLDQVWWLVSPQNPLKPLDGMAPFAERLAGARQAVRHPRIRAVDFETRHGLKFTADTLPRLAQVYPRHRFVWLMGADNLCQISHWRRWRAIFRAVPVAIFDRPGETYRALASKASRAHASARIHLPGSLATAAPPAWCFLFTRRDLSSATAIRRGRN